jgi:hypothetical protein
MHLTADVAAQIIRHVSRCLQAALATAAIAAPAATVAAISNTEMPESNVAAAAQDDVVGFWARQGRQRNSTGSASTEQGLEVGLHGVMLVLRRLKAPDADDANPRMRILKPGPGRECRGMAVQDIHEKYCRLSAEQAAQVWTREFEVR